MARQSLSHQGSRVAIYARVSTANNGQDPALQTHELREYAERRGWKIVREYVDRGFSGSKDSRPALNELLAAVHQRKCDVVLVWKLDRLSRSLKDVLHIMERIAQAAAGFQSITENIDTTTPAGRMMMQMIGSSRSSSAP